MSSSAREGECLKTLVRMAIPLCQQAERECPRVGPGRRPSIPDWVIAVLITVAVAKRRKSKSAQYRFLAEHRRLLTQWLRTSQFPSRSTYFDRYRRAYHLLQQAVRLHSLWQAARGEIHLECVAVDKSLIPTCGARWSKYQAVDQRPAGSDSQCAWTYSTHHGWVLGYGYEVVVTAYKQGVIWPLLASLEPANVRERWTFPGKIQQLPAQTRYVLADKGYDSEDLAECLEETSQGTPRRFICPLQDRHNVGQARQSWRQSHRRRRRHERRQRRRNYMQTPTARRLYARRSVTVEPFNEWFKSLFELHDHCWHRGLDNNRTQVLTALFVYQLLLRYNRSRGRPNAQVKWILDIL